ncbi:MAG: SIR2 family protein [Rhodocyclaceae bacterium]|nr:SIR2 family protein [Rhodocyclaceae bacterium]
MVFFCGAGISVPVGLPGFRGLVLGLFQQAGEPPDKIENDLIKQSQFDRAIGHYEQRIQGGRTKVRCGLPAILSANQSKRRALTTHLALLTLGQSREGSLRLVTTNFDTLFEDAAKHYCLPLPTVYVEPPTRLRWNGVVYLHGRMPVQPSADDLDQLVLSDGDFGQAYLTQGWAARFVAGLFRDYTLCFVGYSIDDPVLRYMTAAHALDGTQTMFAFAPYQTDKAESVLQAWKDKYVIPILYDDADDHRLLHRTLHVLASVYRDGVSGKERLVARYAHRLPKESKPQNDFVGRMLWALSDKSGLPAKRFAECNPVPPLDWLLDAFSGARFRHSDLVRFGVPAHDKMDGNLCFSLICRPAPYDLAPRMRLVCDSPSETQWDDVMHHLARWLVRHLDDPRLVVWIAQRGGQVHEQWAQLIERELDCFARLERDGKTAELDEIRRNAPKAIPSPLMRTLWRILLSGRLKSTGHNPTGLYGLYDWERRLQRDGLTATLRLELRELLAPKVMLKKLPCEENDDLRSADAPVRIRQLVDWELVLTADNVYPALRDFADEAWSSALPHLLDDFQQLLRDALDLMREMGEADEREDDSHRSLPSITPHEQNQGFRDWASLIELLRDAWLKIRANNSARAKHVAQDWFALPYPTFKRLALFAASQEDCIPPEQWVDWLLSEDAYWLWSSHTRREVCRLFVLQGQHFAGSAQARLEEAILTELPTAIRQNDWETDPWQDRGVRSVWLYLSKLQSSGLALGASAAARLAEISAAYPKWKLAANESDEFTTWMGDTVDPEYEDGREIVIAPRKWQELVQWLMQPMPQGRFFYEDTWRDVCRTRFFHSLLALCDLAQAGKWPTQRWREALQTWAEDGMVSRSWRYAAPLVQTMPDAEFQELAHAVSWWMKAASSTYNWHKDILLKLCCRVLALPLEAGTCSRILRNGDEIEDPVGTAINHPIGHVTQALINLWFQRKPSDNDLLPAELQPVFTELCDVQIDRFRHARVLMASQLIAFFRVDRPWTEQHLLPLFGWSHPVEAKAAWQGFLRSPRLYQPLMAAVKRQFLDSANHYADLGEYSRQFANFLTHAALNRVEGYTEEDFRAALAALPQEGQEESARALSWAQESAGEQREEFWKNRAYPFWQQIWPKSRDLATSRMAESLARLAIAARGEFPAALAAVQDWLQPLESPNYVVQLLHKSGLCKQYPEAALRLLAAVIDDPPWASQKLGQCLDDIVQAAPELVRNFQYMKLHEYFQRRGT